MFSLIYLANKGHVVVSVCPSTKKIVVLAPFMTSKHSRNIEKCLVSTYVLVN